MPISRVPTTVKNKNLVAKRREQIIIAAIKLFSKKGFHKTNLRELAKEAGISHGNLYDYVGSKQDIFFLIHEFINAVATEKINRCIENTDDPVERLRRMVRAEFDLMYEWSDVILLLYRETHILDSTLLKALLGSERERILRFEQTLDECIQKGEFRDCNIRVIANLIKAIVESWVMKRWDLRGHVDRLGMEKEAIDFIFNGLLKKANAIPTMIERKELQGRSVLIINAGTMLGKSISDSLLSKGAKLTMQVGSDFSEDRESATSQLEKWKEAKIYSIEEYGPMTISLFAKITRESGPFDIIIYDLGTGGKDEPLKKNRAINSLFGLQLNLYCAQNLTNDFQEAMNRTSNGRVIFIAPWAWEEKHNSAVYQTTKAAIIELTRNMAKQLTGAFNTVNCIIPGFIGGIRPMKIQKEQSSETIKRIPMGCIGEITDVIEAVNFLLSDKSKYITGESFRIAGGMK